MWWSCDNAAELGLMLQRLEDWEAIRPWILDLAPAVLHVADERFADVETGL